MEGNRLMFRKFRMLGIIAVAVIAATFSVLSLTSSPQTPDHATLTSRSDVFPGTIFDANVGHDFHLAHEAHEAHLMVLNGG
jgi:hypothetical protein